MAGYQYLKCHLEKIFFQPAVMTILNKPSFLLASKSVALLIIFNFSTVHIQFSFPLVREVCKRRLTYVICNVFLKTYLLLNNN